jgi:hypothetical protein
MLTKRLLLAAFALALLIPAVGCHHKRCCTPATTSFAPPPAPCCDAPRPPAYIPAGPIGP